MPLLPEVVGHQFGKQFIVIFMFRDIYTLRPAANGVSDLISG